MLLGLGEWFFVCKVNSVIPIRLQKMGQIDHTVSEILAHSNGTATSSDWGFVVTNLIWVNDARDVIARVTSSRVWRRARRHRCTQQNGLGVLSTANFELLKSDHYLRRYGQFCETRSFQLCNNSTGAVIIFGRGAGQIGGGAKFQWKDIWRPRVKVLNFSAPDPWGDKT